MHPYVDVLKKDLPRFGAPTPSSDMSRSSPLRSARSLRHINRVSPQPFNC